MARRFWAGMTLRQAKWIQCDWPHAIMSREYELALTKIIIAWRPWMVERAAGIAGPNEQLADELVQSAMIELWRVGLERLAMAEPALVTTILRRAMSRALFAELKGIMRNGPRLLSFT